MTPSLEGWPTKAKEAPSPGSPCKIVQNGLLCETGEVKDSYYSQSPPAHDKRNIFFDLPLSKALSAPFLSAIFLHFIKKRAHKSYEKCFIFHLKHSFGS